MSISLSLRARLAAGVVLCAALVGFAGLPACAQAQESAAASQAGRGRILLVLPFDNRSGQPSLEWIREAAADLLGRRFTSAGFAPMNRVDRVYALDHLGLPQGFHPSRASALKLAQTLDADSIVVGSFTTDGSDVLVEASIVNVPHLRMSQSITARGPMAKMADVFDSLAWKLTRQMDPGFGVAEETFVAAGRDIRLDAYEQYIRGITEPDQAERLRHLQKSVQMNPAFGSAWMALGREQFASQQYEQAAIAFSKVGHADPDLLEAGFSRGLSLMFSGNYRDAEQAFAGVARVLPLGEVLNNQGVAASRQGHDATDLFLQAASADPASADYHFNIAVSLHRHNQTPGALNELAQCLKLHPADLEALDLQSSWKSPQSSSEAMEPLERIVRNFDAAAFRQAAQVMDQMESTRMAALDPGQRAAKLAAQASSYLDRGLILEAERLFQDAVTANPRSAEAHAGLAQVRERSGDNGSARKQAHTALEFGPSVAAWLVLARLDLAAGKVDEASRETSSALQVDPANTSAQQLQLQILARTGQRK
ncbi:MAG: tetratricopeptide repeat protein [Terracidiphilus sp.]|nr:tetratricopeptide repeat protein [Terracidiphilus sp.]